MSSIAGAVRMEDDLLLVYRERLVCEVR